MAVGRDRRTPARRFSPPVNHASVPTASDPIRTIDVIRKKRDGFELSPAEIDHVISKYTSDDIPDYQVSALLMAGFLRGFTRAETVALTNSMLHSGDVLDLSGLSAKKVDKHSTGGVGDKTSFIVAPIAAAAGLVVPMISGRGLGHTGGTLDKLQAIPGLRVNLSLAEFQRVLEKCGCAIIGQTQQLAPADRKIYAMRDVTATVESPALICASIMSKKLAEGIDALVLDVKTGSGAFMKKEEDAIALAELMVDTGEGVGKKTVALITDMDQPLGHAVGNAVEIEEVSSVLQGRGPHDLLELCLELAAQMLYLGDHAASISEGKSIAKEMIGSGKALERFRAMVQAQGGNAAIIEHPEKLPKARHRAVISSSANGFVQAMQCERIGSACVVLGGGRERKEDSVDHSVGIIVHKKVGDRVATGEPLCDILYNSEERAEGARRMIERSYQISDVPPRSQRPLVRRIISKSDARPN